MLGYALTVFLSAFLLFQVQPLIGKYILPWFGGGPAVWVTCLLFFQATLLVGYVYAHVLAARLLPRNQGRLHLVLLVASLLFLPIAPAETWKPSPDTEPTLRIFLLLGVTLGAPYLLLSSTAPLLQRWFSGSFPGRSPYRLYALSNVGSLLALLSYPFVVEPLLTLARQVTLWSWGYATFAACAGVCAVWRATLRRPALAPGERPAAADFEGQLSPYAESDGSGNPRLGTLLLWLALAACGSACLLATTNKICQEVAVVPFLWVLPLSIYLLTFVICFDRERWYVRPWFGVALVLVAPATCAVLFAGVHAKLWIQVAVYSLTLFICCMTCHGELVRSKPRPRHLTVFYLAIASGGALGGAFVALVAPSVFLGYWEYHISIAGCYVLTLISWYCHRVWGFRFARLLWILLGATTVAANVALSVHALGSTEGVLYAKRGFYGVLRIVEKQDSDHGRSLVLRHGSITHGFQYTDPEKRCWPTAYYGAESAVGLALEHHPRRLESDPSERGLRVAVVGLGTGTIAAHGQPGDYFRFYEIDPEVVRLSEEFFTYRQDSPADVEIIVGDARIRMEEELARRELQKFDVLAVDAFSSDAIPVHLLTQECVEVYWQHLKKGGILLLHISNRFLDLNPVVRGLAMTYECRAVRISSEKDTDAGTYSATWVILTTNESFLDSPVIQEAADDDFDLSEPSVSWTDDFTSLWQLVEF